MVLESERRPKRWWTCVEGLDRLTLALQVLENFFPSFRFD